MRFAFLCSIVFLGLTAAAAGQTLTAPTPAPVAGKQDQAAQPLEITAAQTLEWHRNDEKFIARGNTRARQGAGGPSTVAPNISSR